METTQKRPEAELRKDIGEITQCIYGNWISQVTYVFAELGIADKLLNGPLTLEQLAEACGVIPNYLMRTLRCTFELGYLTFDAATGLYYLTPKGEILSSDHPNTKREEARFNGADYRYHPWGNLLKILQNGMSEEYSPTYKNGSIDYLQDKPELLENFHMALYKKSQEQDYKLIKDYDFSPYSKLMDIGCGRGSFIKTILDENPKLEGCMFDLEHGFDKGVEEKYEGRLVQMYGDFFEEVPDWADVYTMKNVIHNWPEDKTVALMIKTREAMQSVKGNATDPADKRLLIIENLVPENDSHKVANWMDLNFMILIDGAERTLNDYKILGEKSGLKLVDNFETETGRHILSYSLA
jgi:hypothetical protein